MRVSLKKQYMKISLKTVYESFTKTVYESFTKNST